MTGKLCVKRGIPLTDEQKILYRDIRTQARANLKGKELTVTNVVTEILRLHQITCGYFKSREGEIQDVKNNRLDTLIEISEETDQKIIIWATYVYNIEQIKKTLEKKFGVESVVTFYGQTTSDQRTEAIERFQNDPKCRFFIGNPSTGGMGITLTAAGIVVYFSNSYNAEQG